MHRTPAGLAIVSLILVTIVYAINWFNVGALYYLIGPDLQGGVSGLGALTSSFFVGIGLMQVPAGIMSAKLGPRRVLIIGQVVASFAVVGESFSSQLIQIAIFRFVIGAGLAFVFSPSVAIITRLTERNGSGTGVGIVQSSFGVGGLLGLFGWTLLAAYLAWRPSLALGALLLLLGALSCVFFIPRDEKKAGLSINGFVRILKEKSLLLLGLGVICPNLGSILVFSFMPYYLEKELGISAAIAGLVASAIVIVPIFSALWGGRLYNKTRNPRLLLIVSGLSISASLALCAAPDLLVIATGPVVGGLAFGVGTTAGIAASRDMNPIEKGYDSLAVAWVSAISLFGSFWPPIVFSYLASAFGYPQAWLGGAIMDLPLLIPVLLLAKKVPRKETV